MALSIGIKASKYAKIFSYTHSFTLASRHLYIWKRNHHSVHAYILEVNAMRLSWPSYEHQGEIICHVSSTEITYCKKISSYKRMQRKDINDE